ncbi:MAG: PEGA domain-containing protein [Acidobacteriota bacterium]
MKYMAVLFSLTVLMTNGSCTAHRPSNKFGVPSPVEQSIRTWQDDNNIDLSESAFALLVEQAGEDCSNCMTTYHYGQGDPSKAGASEHATTHAGTESGVKDPAMTGTSASTPVVPPPSEMRYALYDYYLDQLRDLKRQKGGRSVIEAADIKSYTFTSFLRDIGFGGGAMAKLFVQSRPVTAPIIINGKRKGFTNKRFVVEAGDHRVEVRDPQSGLNCDLLVKLGEFESKTVVCEPPH